MSASAARIDWPGEHADVVEREHVVRVRHRDDDLPAPTFDRAARSNGARPPRGSCPRAGRRAGGVSRSTNGTPRWSASACESWKLVTAPMSMSDSPRRLRVTRWCSSARSRSSWVMRPRSTIAWPRRVIECVCEGSRMNGGTLDRRPSLGARRTRRRSPGVRESAVAAGTAGARRRRRPAG